MSWCWQQLRRGDFFICANERQRDLWIGMLTTLGRVNHATYASDRTLRRLIDVVPFGLSSTPPVHDRPVIKGVWPGVAATDQVVLWGGGVWTWLDVATPLRAMAALRTTHPHIKLCFLGRSRPAQSWFATQSDFDKMQGSVEQLAEELGVLGVNVFFNERWVPVDERGAYFLEADVGIIGHTVNLETHYSARTRALDYLWAGVPIVTMAGDMVAEWVERYDLGQVVPPQDPAAFAAGLVTVLSQPRAAYAPRLAQLAQTLTWEQALQPLLRFCERPTPAGDRDRELAGQLESNIAASVAHRDTVIRDLETALRERDVEIDDRKAWLARLEQAIAERDEVIAAREAEIDDRKAWLATLEQAITERDTIISARDSEIEDRKAWLATLEQGIAERDAIISARDSEIDDRKAWLATLEQGIAERDERIHAQDTEISERKAWLATLEEGIRYRDAVIEQLQHTTKG